MPLPKVRYTGLPPGRGFAFPAMTTGIVQLVNGGGVLFGWCVEETTGLAPARVVIGDGSSSVVNVAAAPITLQSSESTRDFLPSGGMVFQQGITVQVTAGTVAGTVHAVLLDADVIDALGDPRRADYD